MNKLTLSETIVFEKTVLRPIISIIDMSNYMFNIESLRNITIHLKTQVRFLNNAEISGKEKLVTLKQDEIEVLEKMIDLFEARKKMLMHQMG